MGTYLAERADSEIIVLRHEGEDDHTIEFHAGASGASGSGAFAPVPDYLLRQVHQGSRYSLTISVYQWPVLPVTSNPMIITVSATSAEVALQVPSATEPGQVDQKVQEASDGGQADAAPADSEDHSEDDSEASSAQDEGSESAE